MGTIGPEPTFPRQTMASRLTFQSPAPPHEDNARCSSPGLTARDWSGMAGNLLDNGAQQQKARRWQRRGQRRKMTNQIGQRVSGARTVTAEVAPLQVQDVSHEGSVRAAVVALVLVVVSALAIFPFILPSIPV